MERDTSGSSPLTMQARWTAVKDGEPTTEWELWRGFGSPGFFCEKKLGKLCLEGNFD